MRNIGQILARMGKTHKRRVSVVVSLGVGVFAVLFYLALAGTEAAYLVYFLLLCFAALAVPKLLRAIFTTRR